MGLKVLLIGESCIDRFTYGECLRLNPEAPTPVFIPKEQTENTGMVLNVGENMKSLGLEVTIVTNNEKCIKTRYVDINSNYILLRVDEDVVYDPLSIEEIGDVGLYDVVVISDYDKGLISEELINHVGKKSKLSFIDTKKKLGMWVDSVDYIKLNKQEYLNNKEIVDSHLKNKTIVTLGGDGCRCGETQVTCKKVEVRDVVGAGDTFVAGIVCSYLQNGGNINQSLFFATQCATDVVQYKGVVTPNVFY